MFLLKFDALSCHKSDKTISLDEQDELVSVIPLDASTVKCYQQPASYMGT